MKDIWLGAKRALKKFDGIMDSVSVEIQTFQASRTIFRMPLKKAYESYFESSKTQWICTMLQYLSQ